MFCLHSYHKSRRSVADITIWCCRGIICCWALYGLTPAHTDNQRYLSIKKSPIYLIEPFGTRVHELEFLTGVDFQIILSLRRVWRYQRGNQNPYFEEEQTNFTLVIRWHNSIYLKIERKTCPSSERFSLWRQIIHEVYHDSNSDVEQIDTFDWTFTNGKQLHATLSIIDCLPCRSFIYRNISFFFVYFLVFLTIS